MLSIFLGGAVVAAPAALRAQDSDSDGVPDVADVFPCDANQAGVTYFPAEGASALLAFEDQWPEHTDLDFNDVVVRVNYRVALDGAGDAVSLTAYLSPVALGGAWSNGLALQLPIGANGVSARRQIAGGSWEALGLEADADATVIISPNLRELFQGAAGPINSEPGQPRVDGQPITLEVTFANPVTLPLSEAPFDLFVFRAGDFSHQIHLPRYRGTAAMNTALFGTGEDGTTPSRAFVHRTGIPAALELMSTTRYPLEGVQISALFPDIVSFASSGGAQSQDFYSSNVVASQGFDAPPPAVPAAPAPDTSCLPNGQVPERAGSSCQELLANGVTTSGVYWIDLGLGPFQVYCEQILEGGGWMFAWKNLGGTIPSGANAQSNALLFAATTQRDVPPHWVSRRSGINHEVWQWARGRTGREWLKASTLYDPQGNVAYEQNFRMDFGAVTWDWILSRSGGEPCHVAPGPIAVWVNGASLGSTDRVNSYQRTGATYGLANTGNSGQDQCGQPTSNLVDDPNGLIYRLDGGDGLNAIRHVFSYVHDQSGRDSSRCNFACWSANSNGGYGEAFTWLVR